MKINLHKLKPQKSCIGLDINTHSIKLVELENRRDRLILKNLGSETLNGDLNGHDVSQAIERLRKRLDIQNSTILTSMNGATVRHKLIKTPLLSYPETELWLQLHLAEYLPPGIRSSDVAFSFHIGQENHEQQHVLLSIVRKNDIQQRLELLQQAKLSPSAISSGCLDLLNTLALQSDDFFDKTVAIISQQSDKTTVIFCEQGLLADYQEIFIADNNLWGEKIKHLLVHYWQQEQGKPPVAKIFLTGTETEKPALRQCLEEIAAVEIIEPLSGIEKNGQSQLPPDFALATGLAVKGFYPLLNTIDLLPAAEKQQHVQIQEKRSALNVMFLAGGFFLVLYLIISLWTRVVSSQLKTVDEQFSLLNAQIMAIEKLKQENRLLSEKILQVQGIVLKRSHHSERLYELSRMMPQQVWLRELSLGQNKKQATNSAVAGNEIISLAGLAFSAAQVAMFLKSLEDSPSFTNVKLERMVTISAAEVWEKSKLRNIPLVKFIINLEIER